jgi:hypothetical protein
METIMTAAPSSRKPHNAAGNNGAAHAELISVSPALAARWLERNESNRTVREGRVNALAEFSQVDRSDAESFFTLFGTGSGLREGHPIFTLRRALEINANRRTAKANATVPGSPDGKGVERLATRRTCLPGSLGTRWRQPRAVPVDRRARLHPGRPGR